MFQRVQRTPCDEQISIENKRDSQEFTAMNHPDSSTGSLNMAAMMENAEQATRLLKSMANRNRLMMLCMLVDSELSVGELTRRTGLGQAAASQHLAVLRRSKLVTTRKQSQTVYYRLSAGIVGEMIKLLHSEFCMAEPLNGHEQ